MAQWNIVRPLGKQGGFGRVYEVKSTTGQRAALKELMDTSPNNLSRFQREIHILENLKHPNIIEIYEGNINGSPTHNLGPWYIMEYMDGGDLGEKMISMFNGGNLFGQKWSLGTVILPIINALEYAHTHTSHKSFHRDLKPANLLFKTTAHTHLKVADWGLGKDINRESLGRTVGPLGGTNGYSAPEQWYDEPTDGRTDIFQLGVVFYQMMTGKMPPSYNNARQRPTVPAPSQFHPSIKTKAAQLDTIILKMIALNKADRYQTIQEVKKALTPIYNNLN
jgi:serine/threonine protein kinase